MLFSEAMQVQDGATLVAGESNEEIFARVYGEISHGRKLAAVECQVRPYCTTMGRLKLSGDCLEVRLGDLIAGAPATVREALAWILVSKLFRRKTPPHWLLHYRQFMMRRDVRRQRQTVLQVRGRKYISGPQGERHNLDEMFDRLRDRYFDPLMAKPQLGWSRGESRTLLGHFDSAHNAIVLSRRLDRADVPELVVEYVLFHEMLHLKYPVEHRGSRRRVHTSAFKEAEKQFEGLADVRVWLRQL